MQHGPRWGTHGNHLAKDLRGTCAEGMVRPVAVTRENSRRYARLCWESYEKSTKVRHEAWMRVGGRGLGRNTKGQKAATLSRERAGRPGTHLCQAKAV